MIPNVLVDVASKTDHEILVSFYEIFIFVIAFTISVIIFGAVLKFVVWFLPNWWHLRGNNE